MIYLIDEIFWNLGFKNERQAEKVIILIILIIYVFFLKHIILIISIMSQVRVEIGIADHVWQEKRELPLPRLLMQWVIGSSLNCGLDGLSTSARPIQMGRFRQMPLSEKRLWYLVIESLMLLVCMLMIG
jgi:hypothetical protein